MTLDEEFKLAEEMGLTRKFVIDAAYSAIDWSNPYRTPRERVADINKEIREIEKRINNFKTLLFQYPKDSWYIHDYSNELYAEIEKLNRKIFIIKNLKTKDGKTFFDLELIKTVPLDKITEILPSGFFVHNPFRNEASPSNSLHWDKRTNRYKDFATDKHGDACDLFMAVNDCSMITALKSLSTMI